MDVFEAEAVLGKQIDIAISTLCLRVAAVLSIPPPVDYILFHLSLHPACLVHILCKRTLAK